jgi:hypothetical protein
VPRDLADVLHYFLPELEDESEPLGAVDSSDSTHSSDSTIDSLATLATPDDADERALPVLGVPIGDRDVVRAALTWNLAVEIARLGQRAIVLAPASMTQTPLWPEAGIGPLGTELHFCSARNLEELGMAAEKVAKERANSSSGALGALFVRVPPEWIKADATASLPISWWLLMSSPNQSDLSEAHDLAAAIQMAQPASKVGVTIHGVSSVDEAKRAYEHLSRRCITKLGLELLSYGLLVDDLHVYRAIAAQRPIGLAHPQAPATRALMDVARLLAEDAPSISHG